MKRREFLHLTACAAGAAFFPAGVFARHARTLPALSRKFTAADTVTLGKTGIQTSRLAMGTGTVGVGHHSHQTALGINGLSDLLLNGYDRGLRFFDSADSYGSHPHVAEALKHVPREKVTVLTKTWARDAASARADLDRFRRELGTDQIDICLMHCLTEGDWTERFKGVMDVLSEAKQKGIIRAHGCSCHSIEALRRQGHHRHENPWPRGAAQPPGGGPALCPIARPPRRLYNWGRIQSGAGRFDPPHRRSVATLQFHDSTSHSTTVQGTIS